MRKLAYAIAILILLLAVIGFALLALIPASLVKSRLEAAASDRLGRPVTIEGSVRFALFPHLRLEAKQVSIANAPTAGAEPMAKLGTLALDLELLPLLGGTVSLDRLELIDPIITLQVDTEGRPNWALGTPAAAPGSPAQPPNPVTPPGDSAPQQLRLGMIRLTNGKLTYTDQRSGKSQAVEQIDLDVSLPSLDQPLAAEGGLVWNGRKISLSLGIEQPRAFLAGSGSGLSARLGGAVTAGFKGSVALQPRLALKGDVEFDAIKASGDLTIDDSGARPALRGQLTLDRLDLNRYVTGSGGDAPIDFSGLDMADAQLSLALGGITAGRISIGQSQLTMALTEGRLSADISAMALYQGSGTGHVALGSSGALALDCSLHHIQAQPFFKDTIDFGRVTGTGDIALSVTSRGDSKRALIAALAGKGSFALENGAVLGADLNSMFRNIADSFLDAAGGKAPQTPFGRLTGSLTASGGVVRNEDLAMRGSGLDVGGSGMIDLPHRVIDYRLTSHPADLGGLTVPVLIQGSLDTPDYKPDLAGAVEHGVKGVLKAGNPKRLLDGLFGGK